MKVSVADDGELFQNLLRWLDSDPQKAGEQYEEIRRRLIFIFRCRGCSYPEDLADRCFDRVAQVIAKDEFTYEGDPALFIYGVGKMILKEHARSRPRAILIPDQGSCEEKERRHDCLESCISGLTPRSRQLILDYYGRREQTNTLHRQQLAERMGISLNVLRIQTCRIRAVLKQCITRCINQEIR